MPRKKNQALIDQAIEDADALDSMPDDKALGKVTKVAHTIALLELEKIQLEQRQKEVTQELNKYKREFMPEAMQECGMEKFTTVAGVEVTVKDTVFARLNQADQVRGFDWLRQNGLGPIIKTKVTATMKEEDEKLLKKLVATLEKHDISFKAGDEVPWNTLQSAIRERLALERENKAAGVRMKKASMVPRDVFNVYEGPEAKISVKNVDEDKLFVED